MQSPQGIFLVLEGSDGSGKGTQFELLKRRLSDAGYQVEVFDFPRYDKPSSHFIRRYLNGDYGPASSISPYTASLFFALDRYEASADIRAALEAGKVVLSNRYVGSNMAHQGSKFDDIVEKRSFFVWEDSLEFQLLNIPRPNLSIFLRVPAETSYELIKQKSSRSYTDKSHDEHEGDIEHLRKSVQTYDLLCQLFPKDFKAIDCAPNGDLLPIETINSRIWDSIQAYLPYLAKHEPEVQPEQVEVISEEINTETDAAQAESDSFEWQSGKLSLNALIELKKMGIPVAFNWQDSWSGLNAGYEFYTPESLVQDQLKTYLAAYAKAKATHSEIYRSLVEYFKTNKLSKSEAQTTAAHLSRAVIPMGATYKSRLKIEKTTAASYVGRARSSALLEVQVFGEALAKQIMKLWPSAEIVQSGGDSSQSPQAINEILAEISAQGLSQNLSDAEEVKLLDASPKNEFDLLADGLYSYSDLSRSEILVSLEKWNYQQKAEALINALKLNPQILETATYRFDALADRLSLINLLGISSAGLNVQQPTVRYGYRVAPAIEDAHLEDRFMDVFDNFLELYSQLQSIDEGHATDYATLTGHKVRWQGRLNGLDLKQLAGDNRDAEDTAGLLLASAAQVHPIIGEFLATYGNGAKKPNPKRQRSRRKK